MTRAEPKDRGNGHDGRSSRKISLHPLTLEQATKALLETPPPKDEKDKADKDRD